MIRMTRLPEEVTRLLPPLKPYFSYRHYLVFCWLLVAHLVCFGQATVQGLARYTPTHVAAWHLRRLLAAGRWQWGQVLQWLVSETLAAFPPPKDGVLYLVVAFDERAIASEEDARIVLDEDSGTTGPTLGEMAALLIAIGARDALGLDGGFSTSLTVKSTRHALRIEAFRATINAILVHAAPSPR